MRLLQAWYMKQDSSVSWTHTAGNHLTHSSFSISERDSGRNSYHGDDIGTFGTQIDRSGMNDDDPISHGVSTSSEGVE